MVDAMVAMTDDASWKRRRLKRPLVRTLVVHLGLEDVTGRAHILNIVDSRRGRAMVSMTGCTGRRTQVASYRKRFVVDAGAVLCELVCGDGVSLHVIRVSMAASACVRHVDRIHRRTWIAGGSQVVDTMTIRAHWCDTGPTGLSADWG